MFYQRDGIEIDMWGKRRFVSMKYHADATFYPHSSFGYCYCGYIYNDDGKVIGSYAANDSTTIEKHFQIEWD